MSWGGPPSYQQQGQQPPSGYGATPHNQYGYQVPPQQGQGGYRPPPQQGQAGYRPPPQQTPGSYGAPPPQQAPGGYRPPQQAGGYGPPRPTPQAGYQAPPRQAGYQAPPPQAGYQAPPPQAGYQAPPPQPGYQAPGAGYQPRAPVGYAPAAPPGVSPELWGWFQAVDSDRSGKITADELRQALHNGNWTPFNAETCRLMIGMFDRDRSGTIDIHEFAALWKYIQDWKNCFDRFDTDRSGNINAGELMNAFKSFGYNLSMNFVTVCMRTYDRRNLGSINFDDFIQCCVMLKSLTEKFREKDTQQSGIVRIHYEDFLRMVLDNSVL